MGASLNPYRILPLPLQVKTKPRQLAAHWRAPVFAVPWNAFRNSFRGSLFALFTGPKSPRQFLGGNYFRDCWIERRIPLRAIAAAAMLHVIFFLLPYSHLNAARPRTLLNPQVEITWSSPARDLPPLDFPSAKSDSRPNAANHSLPAPPQPSGAAAYQPRQTIFTESLHPTHPRQALINSAAPPEPPKILPPLFNIVQLAQPSQPARPHVLIDREVLTKLHPNQQAMRTVKEIPLPQLPNVEKHVGDLNLSTHSPAPARPVLPLNASAAPRLASRAAPPDAGLAPELQFTLHSAASQTFIALSSAPAPPTEQLPLVHGNLSARLAISPGGSRPGVPGGTATNHIGGPNDIGSMREGNSRSGANVTGISISGGSPAATSPISGIAAPPANATAKPASVFGHLTERPSVRTASPDSGAPPKKPLPNFAGLPTGVKPESILGPQKIYTLHVNMPNLSSATGSWVLSFTESKADAPLAGLGMIPPQGPELTGPVPLRKVDPKYPPALIQERVEGEVVLYAVIRRDGSVDSIQLVKGLDDQLDLNAMEAFSGWKFRPAARAGLPVELEAIVHIPFHVAHSRF